MKPDGRPSESAVSGPVVGLDLGDVRIGVAATDARRTVATPRTVLWRTGDEEKDDAAIAESATRLERYQRIAGTRPMVVRQLDALRGKDPRRYFLRSGAPALSAAAPSWPAWWLLASEEANCCSCMTAPQSSSLSRSCC